ncbi:DUF6602 domain-containing protein [Flavobacterium sp. SM2513]|uniref:DUF6602 domain-containing protein n=1 Tax=Flavobacterium sp. SM2513 TaxID=3424766 RepID=UPI003D7F63E5
MGNKIFETVLNRKIDIFALTFMEDSSSIFYDETKLIHPGEYGKYRENALKDLLRLVTKHRISDGFIITPDDKVSTQLDIVIYKNDEAPLLENNYIDFFSVESVLGIGEVKSTLSKTKFSEALRKLAENKKLHENKKGICIKKNYDSFEHDDFISFLVCASTSFNLQTIDFNDVYKDIEHKYRHNFILIIEKGLIGYQFEFSQLNEKDSKKISNNNGNLEAKVWYEYPSFTFNKNSYKTTDVFHEVKESDKYYHIKLFLTKLSLVLGYKNLYDTDFVHYLNLSQSTIFQK